MPNDPKNMFSADVVKRYFAMTQEADFDFKKGILETHSIVTGLVVKAGLDDYEPSAVSGALNATYAFIGVIKPQLQGLRNTKKEAELKILDKFDKKIEKYIIDLPNYNNYQSYIKAIMECHKALRFIAKKFTLFGFVFDQPEEGDI